MGYKRIHIRIPINGDAFLSHGQDINFQARAIDISEGGVALSLPSGSLPLGRYDIVITIDKNRKIELRGELVRQTTELVGFRIVQMGEESLSIIQDLLYQYQETADFIAQLDKYDVFDLRYVDDDGNEFEVTFEVGESSA